MPVSSMKKIYFVFILLQFGCAHSPSEKLVQNMAIGAAAGFLIGHQRAEYKSTFSAMYAGFGASAAGLVTAYLIKSSDDEFKKENDRLKTEVERFQKQLEPKLVQTGQSLFTSPIPKEVAGLVEPGEWKRYKLDQWVQDPNQPNTWFRQVEMFEIIPPVAK